MKSVAVVGAGPAGLCMARHLLASKQIKKFVAYEQGKEVGGTWVYDGNIPQPKYGPEGVEELRDNNEVNSSMYKSLRTNLPKQLMEYPDFKFPAHKKSFVKHKDVLEYLKAYATENDLHKHVQLNTKVHSIKPTGAGYSMGDTKLAAATNDLKWQVTTVNKEHNKFHVDEFDSIVVCNGHFAKPDIPDIPGIENFKGRLLHSHIYRVPDVFERQNVLVLGGSASGRDIAVEISKRANNVMLSHRGEKQMCELPSNVAECDPLKGISPNGHAILEGGQQCSVDSIVFCTGYLYDLPFLDKSCGVQIKENRISPLYKQVFNINSPSMAFIGVPSIVCPFQMFTMQAEWITNVFEGKTILPEKATMLQDSNAEFQQSREAGIPVKYFHRLDKGTNLDYFKTIVNYGNVKPLSTVVEKMFIKVKEERETNLLNYRDREYVVINDREFQIMDKES